MMKTAEEMYQYCIDNNMGSGFTKKWGLKHFALIEATLQNDEDAVICFMGLHNYISGRQHDSNFAYAVTTKRIIMAQQKIIGQIVQTVMLDNINDITFKSGMVFGTVTIDTIKETFNVNLNKQAAKNVNDRFHDLVLSFKDARTPVEQASAASSSVPSSADEILKYKNLLDMGAITQEEFDAKKKQLLGL